MDMSRFLDKVTIEPGKCWNHSWEEGSRYGRVWHKGRRILAHRYMWQLVYGLVPNDLCVLHKCDNPKCVNPGHLFLGTNQDNIDDKMDKGRHRTLSGYDSPSSKLDRTQVEDIRALLRYGVPQRLIADMYDVGQRTIAKINLGISYQEEL